MLAEIITIGDEILIGQIIDTNSAFISKELNNIGIQVYQFTSIQDDQKHILDALKEAHTRVHLVIVTGGLGPTKDDITKQSFCDYFNDTLVKSDEVLENIENLFRERLQQEPLAAILKQAWVPSKATVLQNRYGTAPGMWFESDETVYISLPGVPFEMKHLLQNTVIPKLIKRYKRPFIYHKTLLTHGMGESSIAERIEQWENELPEDLKLAYLPNFGRVRLRLSSKGFDKKMLVNTIDERMSILCNILSDITIGFETETTIEQKIANKLIKQKKSLSVAESCTGGTIASNITSLAGVSAFFKGGIVAYDTSIKSSVLGIDLMEIEKYSVVSAEIAELMASQVRVVFNSDYGLATTGNAGPTKGDSDADIGTVFIAVATATGVKSEKFNFGNGRERVISKATHKALELLYKEILKN